MKEDSHSTLGNEFQCLIKLLETEWHFDELHSKKKNICFHNNIYFSAQYILFFSYGKHESWALLFNYTELRWKLVNYSYLLTVAHTFL